MDERNERQTSQDQLKEYWEKLKVYSSYVILLGLVGVMAALVSFAWLGELNIVGQVLLILGLALGVLYIALEPQIARRAIAARQTRYGLNALVMSLAFIGIVFLINLALYKYNARHDFTASGEYSISQQTVKILTNLDREVRVIVFMSQNDSRRDKLESLLEEYTRHTSRLRYEFVDPDSRPALARQYGVTSAGTLVFEAGEKRQLVQGTDEQDITSGILKVIRAEAKQVYYLTGHKEPGLDDTAQTGYSKVKAALDKNNYTVAELNLVISGTVPADADVLILAAPRTPLGERELPAVWSYLRNGGKLLLLLDPLQTCGLEDGLREEYGVAFQEDLAYDPASSIAGEPLMPVILSYPWSQITKDLGLTFFPLARSITQTTPSPASVTVQKLLQTSPQSWGETDLNTPNPRFDPDRDIKGPLTLGLTVEKSSAPTGGPTRLVLIGNASFASNVAFDQQSNGELFINCVNWLTEEEDIIAISTKPPAENPLNLMPNQVPPIMFSSVCLLPLLVLGVGALVWWRRR